VTDGEEVLMKAGIDWASEHHDLCLIDDAGQIVRATRVAHDRAGLEQLLEILGRYGEPALLPIAIERPDGLLVDRLLEAGHPVVPIPPAAFAAARDRWSSSGTKSDPADAYRLADFLRTDGHRFRTLTPFDHATRQLRALVRERADHIEARVAATNQLAALLAVHWPGAAAIFGRLDSEIALRFLDNYPTPAAAARLGPKRLAAFCRRNGYSGRRSPEQLLQRLRNAPSPARPLDADIVRQLVCCQSRLLHCLLQTIHCLDRAIAAHLGEHPKTPIIQSLPRSGTISAAQLLAELGPILDHTQSAEQAAAEAGASPVTATTGKRRHGAHFRYATNPKPRQALMLWADNSRHGSSWAMHVYREARARGCRHPHAIRILARAWLRVLWRLWHTNTTYNPRHHRNAQQLTQRLTLT
jgi:transposase